MLFDLRPKTKREELYGREEELDELLASLRSETPLVILLGIKRIGKTSLLKTALNELDVPSMYLDVRRLEEEGYSKVVLYRILSEEMNRLSSRGEKLTEALRHVKGVQVAGSRIELDWSERGPLLSSVFESLNQMMEKRKSQLVIAVDEAQLLKNMVGGKGKIDFRSLVAFAYDKLENIKFVLIGSEIGLLMDFIGIDNPKSSLYGRGREEIMLNRFEKTKSLEFLRKGFEQKGIGVNQEEIERVVNALDGIVGWLTLYGNAASQNRKKKSSRVAKKVGGDYYSSSHTPTDEVLEAAKGAVKSELTPLFSRSRYYKLALVSLARGAAQWSKVKRDISSWVGRPITDTQVTRTLDTLRKLSIVEYERGNYSITDPVVASFARGL